jgi:hypothetical protein
VNDDKGNIDANIQRSLTVLVEAANTKSADSDEVVDNLLTLEKLMRLLLR